MFIRRVRFEQFPYGKFSSFYFTFPDKRPIDGDELDRTKKYCRYEGSHKIYEFQEYKTLYGRRTTIELIGEIYDIRQYMDRWVETDEMLSSYSGLGYIPLENIEEIPYLRKNYG